MPLRYLQMGYKQETYFFRYYIYKYLPFLFFSGRKATKHLMKVEIKFLVTLTYADNLYYIWHRYT